MKRATSAVLLVILVIFIACANSQSADDAPRISKEELKAKLGTPSLVLLDVRTGDDWEKSGEKITDAARMDPGTVDSWAHTLPMDKEIVLYCA